MSHAVDAAFGYPKLFSISARQLTNLCNTLQFLYEATAGALYLVFKYNLR